MCSKKHLMKDHIYICLLCMVMYYLYQVYIHTYISAQAQADAAQGDPRPPGVCNSELRTGRSLI